MTPHAAVPATALPSAVPELHARIGPVLADLAFPAERWQAVTAGELYGVDGVTRSLIGRLPERRYGSLAELIHVLAAVLTGRNVPPVSPLMTGRPRTQQARSQPARTPVPARAAAPTRTAATPTAATRKARVPAAPPARRALPA